MAGSQVRSDKAFTGTSAERIALDTTNVEPNDRFKESDAGDEYEYSGSAWKQISSGGAAHVSGLATNGVLQSAGTYNTTDILGYKILAQGTADWSITLKNGAALTIPFASMVVGDIIPENLASITVGAAGQALLYIPS